MAMYDAEPIPFEVETLDSDGNCLDSVSMYSPLPAEAVAEVIEHLPPGQVEWEFDDEDLHASATLYLDEDPSSGNYLTVNATGIQ